MDEFRRVSAEPCASGGLYFGACPGVFIGRDSALHLCDEAMATAFAQLRGFGVSLLIGLVEDDEIGAIDYRDIEQAARRCGVGLRRLPLPDFSAPDADFMARWRPLELEALAELRAGRGVGVHCLAGMGRSPTMAGRLLIAAGLSPEEVLVRIRAHDTDLVENERQLGFLVESSEAVG